MLMQDNLMDLLFKKTFADDNLERVSSGLNKSSRDQVSLLWIISLSLWQLCYFLTRPSEKWPNGRTLTLHVEGFAPLFSSEALHLQDGGFPGGTKNDIIIFLHSRLVKREKLN